MLKGKSRQVKNAHVVETLTAILQLSVISMRNEAVALSKERYFIPAKIKISRGLYMMIFHDS